MKELINLLNNSTIETYLKKIARQVMAGERLSVQQGLILYEQASLGFLGVLANFIRGKRHGKNAFFNKNFHIEPTNICVYNCKFCSYRRKAGESGAWEYSIAQMLETAKAYQNTEVTEVHIVGGVHPHRDLHFYGQLIQEIKKLLPGIHVKAFTAVELDFMIKKARVPLAEGLQKLKEYGLDSIPGGGAEIFDESIRKQVCHEKSTSNQWLTVHRTAHQTGLPSNATMLYGHIETYSHRIDHLKRLRELQDETGMFNTFIPLKYRRANNSLSGIGEVSMLEDLRNYAVSRIFLDNFPHLKAYWPMIGRRTASIALSFGVDDIDGTIDDSTRIYTMAGAEDTAPAMTTRQLVQLIQQAGYVAVERDTLYNKLRVYEELDFA